MALPKQLVLPLATALAVAAAAKRAEGPQMDSHPVKTAR